MKIKRIWKFFRKFNTNRVFRKRILKNIRDGFELASATSKPSTQLSDLELRQFRGKKIAFVGGCELSYIMESLKSTLIDIETYHTFIYGEATNPLIGFQSDDSAVVRMKPDVIIISHLQETRNYIAAIQRGHSNRQMQEMQLQEIARSLKDAIGILRDKGIKSTIFIINSPIAYRPAFGRFEYKIASDGTSLVEFFHNLNKVFYKVARCLDDVFVLDYEVIFKDCGITPYIRTIDADGIFEHLTNQGAVLVSNRIVRDLQVIYGFGQRIKAIVVDPDDTLWDGTISEDGIGGVAVHRNRLELLRMLSKRGIVVNLCSKNDPSTVYDIERLLGNFMDEVIIKKINWHDKTQNIVEIARELNIGLESIAFFDNNPFERGQVSKQLPEVLVLEDAKIVDALNMHQFDLVRMTNESENKRAMDTQHVKRVIAEKEYEESKIELFRLMEMKVCIFESAPETLDRVCDLIQKSKQLNATSIRFSKQDVLDFHLSTKHIIYIINLRDKYSDYGIVGVAIIEKEKDSWNLITFIFSCRVMGKTVEETLLTYILKKASEIGVKMVTVQYKKTGRNGPIERIFKNSKFEPQDAADEEIQKWVYDLSKAKPNSFYDWFTFVEKS